jgi:hypothetical protein
VISSSTAIAVAVNITTKTDLLDRAKASIAAGYEAGKPHLHRAAELLALASKEHGASQREMAEAVGKSPGWVSALLKWRRNGYCDESPFGPTTKNGRAVQHAERLASSSILIKPNAAATGEIITEGTIGNAGDTGEIITNTANAAGNVGEITAGNVGEIIANTTNTADTGANAEADADANVTVLMRGFEYALFHIHEQIENVADMEFPRQLTPEEAETPIDTLIESMILITRLINRLKAETSTIDEEEDGEEADVQPLRRRPPHLRRKLHRDRNQIQKI